MTDFGIYEKGTVMKRLAGFILVIVISAALTLPVSAMTADEAVDILVPYEDEHIMTRNECITALSRMVGVNDDALVSEAYSYYYDASIKHDIDSFRGRGIFLSDSLFENSLAPTRTDFYFGNTNFYGDYPASVPDVLAWMLNVLRLEKSYEGKDNLKSCAYDVGLLTNDSETMHNEITAYIFKILAKRFLMCTAYVYIGNGNDEIPPRNYPIRRINIKELDEGFFGYDNPDLKYLDIFNQTYLAKNIYIKTDGIYLDNDKVDFEGKQPFTDATGTMLMPVRWFAELFGFKDAKWNVENGEAILAEYKKYPSDSFKMKFVVGSSEYEFVDSYIKPYDFGIPAQIIDACMYVPLRTVCESLMYNVIWDNE